MAPCAVGRHADITIAVLCQLVHEKQQGDPPKRPVAMAIRFDLLLLGRPLMWSVFIKTGVQEVEFRDEPIVRTLQAEGTWMDGRDRDRIYYSFRRDEAHARLYMI